MSTLSDIRETLGFKTVAAFQTAWNLGPELRADGQIGPKTTAAVRESIDRHHANAGDISAHFNVAEFKCHCGGKLPGCRLVLIHRDLLIGLERLRAEYNHQVHILDGYRCPRHNASVAGSASASQHQFGLACDPQGLDMGQAAVRRLGVFSGIGSKRANPHRVEHVDVRHVSAEHNLTHSTVHRPALWYYA